MSFREVARHQDHLTVRAGQHRGKLAQALTRSAHHRDRCHRRTSSPAAATRSASRISASAWSDRRRLPCWAMSVRKRTLASSETRGIRPREAWFRYVQPADQHTPGGRSRDSCHRLRRRSDAIRAISPRYGAGHLPAAAVVPSSQPGSSPAGKSAGPSGRDAAEPVPLVIHGQVMDQPRQVQPGRTPPAQRGLWQAIDNLEHAVALLIEVETRLWVSAFTTGSVAARPPSAHSESQQLGLWQPACATVRRTGHAGRPSMPSRRLNDPMGAAQFPCQGTCCHNEKPLARREQRAPIMLRDFISDTA